MTEIIERLSKIENGFKPIEFEAKKIFDSNSIPDSLKLANELFENDFYQVRSLAVNFVSNPIQMKKKKSDEKSTESFENLQLKKRIEELEAQLKDAQMKAIAFSTMVDIAENEFNIPIRKKYNTKPSKK